MQSNATHTRRKNIVDLLEHAPLAAADPPGLPRRLRHVGHAEARDPAKFARVHRSAIVNLACVRAIQPWFRGEYLALLASGAKVRIGGTYRDALFRVLQRT